VDVAILGNSLAEGPGVGLEGEFSTRLAQRLGGAAVLDLAIGGGAPEHQLRIYRRYLRTLRPRVVVSTLWVASDLDNALNFHNWLASDQHSDFWTFRSGAEADSMGRGAGREVREFLKRHVRLIDAIVTARIAWPRRGKYTEIMAFPNGDTVYLSGHLQERLALGLRRSGLPTLPEVFFGPLALLKGEVEKDGGRFVVALLPSKEELYGAERFPPVRRTVEAVEAGLDSVGVPWLDLYRPVREGAGQESAFFRRDIHLNLLGNELVAREIEEWIGPANSAARAPGP
jgi:hypothetical protein